MSRFAYTYEDPSYEREDEEELDVEDEVEAEGFGAQVFDNMVNQLA